MAATVNQERVVRTAPVSLLFAASFMLTAGEAAAGRWADGWVQNGRREFRQLPGSETCAPVTVMNAARFQGKNIRRPNRVLRMLDRVGRTSPRGGTTDGGMERQAAALGMRALPLGKNFDRARRLTQRGVPIAAAIDPGRLPNWVQRQHGGPWESIPASHEVLIRKIGPNGGAMVEDPEAGIYWLGRRQLRRAVGRAGDLVGLPLR
jgi:hypothetical protein